MIGYMIIKLFYCLCCFRGVGNEETEKGILEQIFINIRKTTAIVKQ